MPERPTRHLAVLGSPIEHSKSPVLHSVAYGLLGLPFDYGRAEVGPGGLPAYLAGLDESWLGLSLTMPLKREVVPLLATASPLVRQLGVANTVVVGADGLHGHNTDVDGIVRALEPAGRGRDHAVVLGGGATAASALAALADLGVGRVTVHLRDVGRAGPLVALAEELGLPLEALPLPAAASEPVGNSGLLDFVISTLPGGVSLPTLAPESPTALLLDVAYDPWPSPLATAWEAHGGTAVSGLDMLVEQAIGQIRLFAGGRQEDALEGETRIRQALRSAVGLPA